MNSTLGNIVNHVLVQNRVQNQNKRDLDLQLQIHPSYPSFEAITDTLDYFHIDNIAVAVPLDALDQLPESFITLVTTDNGSEIVAASRKNGNIRLKFTTHKKTNYTFDEFKDIWISNVIAVEYASKSNTVYANSLLEYLSIGVFLIASSILSYFYSATIYQFGFLLISIVGTVVTALIVRERLGGQSKVIQRFCSTIRSTCDQVVKSEEGMLWNKLSLADSSFIFFTSLTAFQLLFGFENVLVIPAILSIPFVVYAVYLQTVVLKKWCALCAIVSMLCVSLVVIASIVSVIDFQVLSVIRFLVVGSLVALLYSYSKFLLEDRNYFKKQFVALNHFKRDRQIFDHLLVLSDKVLDVAVMPDDIVLGNSNASFSIICVTNPMCGYCKKAFEAYAKVLRSMKDRIQIIVRMNIEATAMDTAATQIGLRLMEIYQQEGADAFIAAYSEWFENRVFDTWAEKYGKGTLKSHQLTILDKQAAWLEENNLHATPTTIINQKVYPEKYTYNEFFYFINMLVERHYKQNEQTRKKP